MAHHRKLTTPSGDQYRFQKWGAGLYELQKKYGKEWMRVPGPVYNYEQAELVVAGLKDGKDLSDIGV